MEQRAAFVALHKVTTLLKIGMTTDSSGVMSGNGLTLTSNIPWDLEFQSLRELIRQLTKVGTTVHVLDASKYCNGALAACLEGM